jgi:hypothetical protein
VYQNKADLRGAGIHIGGGGRIVMFNSTVSGNEVLTATYSSEMGGGGISVSAGGRMEIQYSTITSNTTALSIREGILITSQADLKMDSSIIANHIDDCLNLGSGSTFSDGGFNFVGDSSSPGSCPFPISILSGDPLLAPLADNGGKTKTHALLPDSKAIDQIPVNFCTVPNDQRNWPRPRGAGCDIGAYERAFTVYTPIVFKE